MDYVLVRRILRHWKNAKLLLTVCTERLEAQNHPQIFPKGATYTQEVLTRIGILTAQGVNTLMAIQFVNMASLFNKLLQML